MRFLIKIRGSDVCFWYEDAKEGFRPLHPKGEARNEVSCREDADKLWDWTREWDGESPLDVCLLASETGEAVQFLTESAAEILPERLENPTQWKESILRDCLLSVCGTEVCAFDAQAKRFTMEDGSSWLVSGLYPDFTVPADVKEEAEKEVSTEDKAPRAAVFVKGDAKTKKNPKKEKAKKAEVSHEPKKTANGKREMTPEQRRAHIDEEGENYVYTIDRS